MGVGRIVTVQHEYVGNWHVFTSQDVRNLYVASPDPLKAYNDIPLSLQKLVQKNEGVECSFVHRISADEFLSTFIHSFELEAA